MKRIVIDARIINSSTGRYIERFLSNLQDLDTENQYIVLVPTKDLGYWHPRGKNFQVVASDYKSYSLGEQLGFCLQLYKLRADLVHFCMPQQPLLYFRPHVSAVLDMTLFSILPSDKNRFVFRFKQFVGKFVFFAIGHTSRHILTISDFTKHQYAKFSKTPESRITTTYLAADSLSSVARRPTMVDADTKFLLFVGQQNEHKNVRGLVAAHQDLLKSHPDLKLVFAGKIKDAVALNKQWFEAEGYTNIIFTDFVSDEELVWLFENCRTCVLPAFIEGFGLPGLEAMRHGAAVASSNTSCLPEIYGEAALYFDPYSTADMAQTIARVLDDEGLRKKLITAGHKQVQKYSWHKMAEQTKAVYNSVLDSTM